jgi:hypothetical protein
MAPKFFRLLTTSSNNWMLIKVNRNQLNNACQQTHYWRDLR